MLQVEASKAVKSPAKNRPSSSFPSFFQKNTDSCRCCRNAAALVEPVGFKPPKVIHWDTMEVDGKVLGTEDSTKCVELLLLVKLMLLEEVNAAKEIRMECMTAGYSEDILQIYLEDIHGRYAEDLFILCNYLLINICIE
ncbi:hypothetical protein L6452_24224 [Arctium lappa]|uniref:Uncharacterized protein n=1 Tax=Arctium lappa TaxID=4217 RepID=A0ACB9A8Z4_ARCLA|nr:hypothetical protein L6452_24224 [Arctium lappa]